MNHSLAAGICSPSNAFVQQQQLFINKPSCQPLPSNFINTVSVTKAGSMNSGGYIMNGPSCGVENVPVAQPKVHPASLRQSEENFPGSHLTDGFQLGGFAMNGQQKLEEKQFVRIFTSKDANQAHKSKRESQVSTIIDYHRRFLATNKIPPGEKTTSKRRISEPGPGRGFPPTSLPVNALPSTSNSPAFLSPSVAGRLHQVATTTLTYATLKEEPGSPRGGPSSVPGTWRQRPPSVSVAMPPSSPQTMPFGGPPSLPSRSMDASPMNPRTPKSPALNAPLSMPPHLSTACGSPAALVGRPVSVGAPSNLPLPSGSCSGELLLSSSDPFTSQSCSAVSSSGHVTPSMPPCSMPNPGSHPPVNTSMSMPSLKSSAEAEPAPLTSLERMNERIFTDDSEGPPSKLARGMSMPDDSATSERQKKIQAIDSLEQQLIVSSVPTSIEQPGEMVPRPGSSGPYFENQGQMIFHRLDPSGQIILPPQQMPPCSVGTGRPCLPQQFPGHQRFMTVPFTGSCAGMPCCPPGAPRAARCVPGFFPRGQELGPVPWDVRGVPMRMRGPPGAFFGPCGTPMNASQVPLQGNYNMMVPPESTKKVETRPTAKGKRGGAGRGKKQTAAQQEQLIGTMDQQRTRMIPPKGANPNVMVAPGLPPPHNMGSMPSDFGATGLYGQPGLGPPPNHPVQRGHNMVVMEGGPPGGGQMFSHGGGGPGTQGGQSMPQQQQQQQPGDFFNIDHPSMISSGDANGSMGGDFYSTMPNFSGPGPFQQGQPFDSTAPFNPSGTFSDIDFGGPGDAGGPGPGGPFLSSNFLNSMDFDPSQQHQFNSFRSQGPMNTGGGNNGNLGPLPPPQQQQQQPGKHSFPSNLDSQRPHEIKCTPPKKMSGGGPNGFMPDSSGMMLAGQGQQQQNRTQEPQMGPGVFPGSSSASQQQIPQAVNNTYVHASVNVQQVNIQNVTPHHGPGANQPLNITQANQPQQQVFNFSQQLDKAGMTVVAQQAASAQVMQGGPARMPGNAMNNPMHFTPGSGMGGNPAPPPYPNNNGMPQVQQQGGPPRHPQMSNRGNVRPPSQQHPQQQQQQQHQQSFVEPITDLESKRPSQKLSYFPDSSTMDGRPGGSSGTPPGNGLGPGGMPPQNFHFMQQRQAMSFEQVGSGPNGQQQRLCAEQDQFIFHQAQQQQQAQRRRTSTNMTMQPEQASFTSEDFSISLQQQGMLGGMGGAQNSGPAGMFQGELSGNPASFVFPQ